MTQTKPTDIYERGIPLILFLIGFVMMFHPTIFSLFRNVQTNPGDPRFINAILEHEFQWFKTKNINIWNPSFFYPAKNILAYSDVLMSVAPFYVVWRIFGFLPDTAFQLWLMTLATLNYWIFYYAINKSHSFCSLGSATGAFVFGFGSPRIAQLGHPQMLAQFFTILALTSLIGAFQSTTINWRHLAVFFTCCVAEIYSSYYWGWAFAFSVSIAMAWGLGIKEWRSHFFSFLKRNLFPLLFFFSGSLICLYPLANHYLDAAREVGFRKFSEIQDHLPTLSSWLSMGKENWIYGWNVSDTVMFHDDEQHLGVGTLTLIMAIIGLVKTKRPSVRIASLVGIVLFLLTTHFSASIEPWRYVFKWVPGANAIRAVSRMGILLLIPVALGVAEWISSAWHARKPLVVSIVLLMILEQGQTTAAYDKLSIRNDVQKIAASISPECKSFLYTPFILPIEIESIENKYRIPIGFKLQMDAIWVQFETRKPTINGYSGNSPPMWYFIPCITNPKHEKALETVLRVWCETNDWPFDNVCWIKRVNN